ncbi:hypothetical protein C0993_007815, partial [Termitomyces sp. T159_Od127]
ASATSTARNNGAEPFSVDYKVAPAAIKGIQAVRARAGGGDGSDCSARGRASSEDSMGGKAEGNSVEGLGIEGGGVQPGGGSVMDMGAPVFDLPLELNHGLGQLDLLLAGHWQQNMLALKLWMDIVVNAEKLLLLLENLPVNKIVRVAMDKLGVKDVVDLVVVFVFNFDGQWSAGSLSKEEV